MVLNEDVIAVLFDLDISGPELEAILAAEPALSGHISEGPAFYSLVGVAIGTEDSEILATIARLNETPGVRWANPIVRQEFWRAGVFCRYCGGEVAVNGDFIVEFSSATSAGEIESLFAMYAVSAKEVARDADRVRFSVRRTVDSEYSTLELANLFHEHALTLRAYPQFLPFAIQ